MPPRPFPYPLGIGTDVVHTSRIAKLVGVAHATETSSKLQPFLNRFLTLREQQHFRARFASDEMTVQENSQTVRYLAGRWAAKEAVIKAVHPRRVMLTDVEIFKYPSDGQTKGVFALIRNAFASSESADSSQDSSTSVSSEQVDYEQLEGQIAKISISHDGDYATAVCLAVNEPSPGDVGGEAAARMP